METLLVETPGHLSTVQDLGRFYFQDCGVPVSGAMDPEALKLGNILVGNPCDDGAIEILRGGFKARFLGDAVFAVTGMDPIVSLNGEPVKPWSCVRAFKNDVVEVESEGYGAWNYLCIEGGIDVPIVLGSKSTYLRGGFGGFDGRALKKGDVICTKGPVKVFRKLKRVMMEIPLSLRPPYCPDPVIRVILGPQEFMITEAGIETFLTEPYMVTPRSDRMGMMLDGPPLEHKKGADIISDGIALGSIQVPGKGLPFVLMADRPTTGGYAKIATVASIDIPLLAQALPGNMIRFRAVSIDEARELNLKRAYRVKRLQQHFSYEDMS